MYRIGFYCQKALNDAYLKYVVDDPTTWGVGMGVPGKADDRIQGFGLIAIGSHKKLPSKAGSKFIGGKKFYSLGSRNVNRLLNECNDLNDSAFMVFKSFATLALILSLKPCSAQKYI